MTLILVFAFHSATQAANPKQVELEPSDIQVECNTSLGRTYFRLVFGSQLRHEEQMPQSRCAQVLRDAKAVIADAAKQKRNVSLAYATTSGSPFDPHGPTPTFRVGRANACEFRAKKVLPACGREQNVFASLNCRDRMGAQISVSVVCATTNVATLTADQCLTSRVRLTSGAGSNRPAGGASAQGRAQ